MKTINSIKKIVYLLLPFVSWSCVEIKDNQSPSKYIMKEWQISDYKFSGISALTTEEADKYIGQKIKLDSNYVIYFNDSISYPKYEFKRVESNSFFHEGYKTNKDVFSVNVDSLLVFDIICENEGYYNIVFVEEQNILIQNIDGVFFILTPLIKK